MRRVKLIVLLFVLSLTTAFAQNKPNVVILATGGTIAGAGNSNVEGQYKAGQLPVEELLNAVPEAKYIANLKGEQISNIGSQEMNDQVWLKLAKRIKALLAQDDVDGIVVTHGTDTMEETAFFIDLTHYSDKPVVFVGAMRSATALSAEGPKNLYDAIATAAHPNSKGKGTLIVMNDVIQHARFITKGNSTQVNAFTSKEFGVLGYVYNAVPEYYMIPARLTTPDNVFDLSKIKTLPRVELLYGYSNQSDVLAKALVKEKVDGIVNIGVGNGNIYPTVLHVLEDASLNKGISVVRSARVGSGRTSLDAEIDDDQYKFVASDVLNGQKSRVLLMLALTKTKNYQEIQNIFLNF